MVPKYIQLKETINNEILKGTYPIGSKLPTEVQLADMYQVSRSTVRQALQMLSEEGIINKHWGSANTVISKSDTSKKKIVVILVPFKKNPYYSILIENLTAKLLKEGLTPEVHESKNHLSEERTVLSSMINDLYGGLIIAPALSGRPSTNCDLLQLLLKRKTPIVFINTAPVGIYNPAVISADDYSKGYQMARSFINSGHKKIGGIFVHDRYSSICSFSGFVDAIRDAGLTINDGCFLWINSVDPQGCTSRSSSSINRFLKYAYETVSVVYVDDSTINTDGAYPLYKSTLSPTKDMGKEAAKLFLEIKKNGNSSSVTIPYK
ncbi:GntR family transcriptional regulator, arabinose operon transcriptional repressor [Pseudobutyrivibrio sp. YE44]|uniref:GntR family transcriptional regulator n=1 Tax=Pseudobutyrivibrio sp. YE44 TaxID=1520802 RepID=UPI0008850CC7|nr:GntR family transcriptional regulator [Pseudobutyrivibrio sp. YE44]SDB51774.1 GntR family transcriptional regulator, arabinose operon transcriptional repressor [Pseudobutyrivibrio sp. YE44]